MKRLRLCAALLFALALLPALPACAQTWEGAGVSLQAPDELLCLTPQTPPDDALWALASIADANSRLKEYQEMGVLVNFVERGGGLSIQLMRRKSDYAQQVYNLTTLPEEERQKVLDDLAQSSEQVQVEKSFYQGEAWLFYRIQLDADTGSGTAHELIYGTIVNGYAWNLDLYSQDGPITPEQEETLLGLVDSLSFSEVLEKPAPGPAENPAVSLSVLALLVVLVAAPFVLMPIKTRREKASRAALAQQLSDYRKAHPDSEDPGTPLFVNSTDCTREAIHAFSLYHTYGKSLLPLLLGTLICLLLLGAAFLLDMVWWVKLLVGAMVIYQGYRLFDAPRAFEKVQRQVYKRGPSDTARYTFFAHAFRVAGIQSASMFPYFQLTDVRRRGQYIYLYYGPENAYMVDTYGFALGEAEAFYSFIQEKVKEKKAG